MKSFLREVFYMYNINILTECNDEFVRAAIVAAACEMLGSGESSLDIRKMKRGSVNSPVWNSVSRQENLSNKF